MRRLVVLLLLGAAATALVGCAGHRPAGVPGRDHVTLAAGDRVLVLAPHPDDEVLGAAGVIQRAVEQGLPVHVAFLTSGDFNEWSFTLHRRRPALTPAGVRRTVAVRQREALAAARELGLAEDQVTFLGYPDAGTLRIWSRHWGERPPYVSRLTRVRRVPYEEAMSTGAPYRGESVLADLARLLDEHRPTRIFLSHPADSHPDHQALYLFTRVVLWKWGEEPPRLHPYLVHYPGWPGRGLLPWARLVPPADLEEVAWASFPLRLEEIDDKLSALRRHATQYRTGRRFLRRFVRANELFGDFPLLVLAAGERRELAHEGEPTPIPDWLGEDEGEPYVVPEQAEVRRLADAVEVRVALNRPLGRRQILVLAFHGFRPDVDFAAMPKLQVRVGARGYGVYDQGTRLPPDSVRVTGEAEAWTVRVPLAGLGDPDRLLLGGRIELAGWPRSWLPWRAVALPPEG